MGRYNTSTVYRACLGEGARRRVLLQATCANYERAALQFAALEDAAMHLTVRLEHVAALEAHAAGTLDTPYTIRERARVRIPRRSKFYMFSLSIIT